MARRLLDPARLAPPFRVLGRERLEHRGDRRRTQREPGTDVVDREVEEPDDGVALVRERGDEPDRRTGPRGRLDETRLGRGVEMAEAREEARLGSGVEARMAREERREEGRTGA